MNINMENHPFRGKNSFINKKVLVSKLGKRYLPTIPVLLSFPVNDLPVAIMQTCFVELK